MIETDIIKRPMMKRGPLEEKYGRYGFVVDVRANKFHIKRAVQGLYKVDVVNVKTCIMPGKLKKANRFIYKTPKFKKAIVQIKTGQSIDIFENI